MHAGATTTPPPHHNNTQARTLRRIAFHMMLSMDLGTTRYLTLTLDFCDATRTAGEQRCQAWSTPAPPLPRSHLADAMSPVLSLDQVSGCEVQLRKHHRRRRSQRDALACHTRRRGGERAWRTYGSAIAVPRMRPVGCVPHAQMLSSATLTALERWKWSTNDCLVDGGVWPSMRTW